MARDDCFRLVNTNIPTSFIFIFEEERETRGLNKESMMEWLCVWRRLGRTEGELSGHVALDLVWWLAEV